MGRGRIELERGAKLPQSIVHVALLQVRCPKVFVDGHHVGGERERTLKGGDRLFCVTELHQVRGKVGKQWGFCRVSPSRFLKKRKRLLESAARLVSQCELIFCVLAGSIESDRCLEHGLRVIQLSCLSKGFA